MLRFILDFIMKIILAIRNTFIALVVLLVLAVTGMVILAIQLIANLPQ